MLKHIICITIIVLLLFTQVSSVWAEEIIEANESELKEQIQEYEAKIKDLQVEKNSLSNQIEYIDTQTRITNLRITETAQKIDEVETEINVLGERISNLDSSLDTLTSVLLERIVAGYKIRQVSFLDILLDSSNVSSLVNRATYYRLARDQNKKNLVQVVSAKSNFEEQQLLRERKKEDLDKLQKALDKQNEQLLIQENTKQKLLEDTQNDEQKYQSLLQQLRAEYAAIQQILSGSGDESIAKSVKKGETIATVIPGASCNSSGSHLHFIVQDGSSVVNPLTYLKRIAINNCSGSSCGSGDGDNAEGTGSWDWPLTEPITLSQGYGRTWTVRNTYVGSIYNSHNGIDITSSSLNVTAISDGEMTKGSYTGTGGCALPYLKLKHADSNFTTFYLHVQ